MSIFIKGISMPKYGELNITIDAFCGVAYTDRDMKEYDVIEVSTTHGDLIDKEDLKLSIEHYHGRFRFVNESPVVIESEE